MPDVSAFCPACGISVAEPHPAVNSRDRALGALVYVGLIPAIILLLIPALRGNRFVRFHSWQSLLFAVSTGILALILKILFAIFSILPVIGFLLAWLSLGLGFLAVVVLWVVLVTKAAQGQTYELPLIGPLAARLAE